MKILKEFLVCEIEKRRFKFHILVLFNVLLALYFVQLAGGLQAFTTRASEGAFLNEAGWSIPKQLIFTHFIRPFLFWGFISFLFISAKSRQAVKGIDVVWLLFALIPALVFNNPFARARFYAFTIMFGGFVIFTYRKLNKSVLYVLVLFIGIVLSRTINIYRDLEIFDFSKMTLSYSPGMLLYGDFDAYENFIHIINYVESHGLKIGRQLLGTLLFFVPRSVWEAKPIGSMWMVAMETLPTERFNRAAPMISEWYINFHFVGVVFAAFLYAGLSAVLDKRYHWSFSVFNERKGKYDFYQILYPFMLGFFLFHLRGDFMSSYAYFVGVFLAFITLYLFLKLGNASE